MLIMIGCLVAVTAFLIAIVVNIYSRPKLPTTFPTTTIVASATLRVGSQLPNTPVLHELIGNSSSSIAAIAGHHPIVINFFASYCTACAQEMKTFAQVARSQNSVVFIGIDTTEPSPAKARSIVTTAGIGYPVLLDNAAAVMTNTFGLANLPTTFFINASGKITSEVLGLETSSDLRAHLAKI
jgi:thiol-disulfide isomerase/thioredoxin